MKYPTSEMEDVTAADESKLKQAHKVALENRKFEIDNYWKRTAYFWTIIGAVFVAYGLSSKETSGQMTSVWAGLGLVLSLSWVLANRASKFWQENWEAHVDLLENKISGPVYKTILFSSRYPSNPLTDAYPYSVSKINQIVSVFVLLIWFVLFIAVLFPNLNSCPKFGEPDWFKALVGFGVLAFSGILLHFGKSSFAGSFEVEFNDSSHNSSNFSSIENNMYKGITRNGSSEN